MSSEEAMFEIGRYYEEGIRPSEEAIKHIIHVLQNTDDDCISRRAVLDIINFEDKWLIDAKKHNSETEIAFSGMKSRIAELPSVTLQEPKIGHWIINEWSNISCSECGCTALYDKVYPGESVFGKAIRVKTTFCPTCGARMAESEDKE